MQKRCILNPQVVVSYFISTSWGLYTIISEGKFTQPITFISLDTFRSVVQNIDTEQKAWLSFLTADDPDEIVRLVNAYPEFLPCYRDIISFRRRPKDLITTFSDALREMDRNTEVYMVEQLAKEVQEKDHALAEKDNVIAEKDNALAEKDNALAEQAKLIEQLKKRLAETRSTD